MQVGTTKDQGLYNKPSDAVHPGTLAAGTLPQYNTIITSHRFISKFISHQDLFLMSDLVRSVFSINILWDDPNNILHMGTNYEAIHYVVFSIPSSLLPLSSKRPLQFSVPRHPLSIQTAVFQVVALFSLRGNTRWPYSVLT